MTLTSKPDADDSVNGADATDSPPRYHVLVVEDNPDHVWMMQRTLSASGEFKVTAARSAREAREALKRNTFDAIVSDHRLPDTEGLRFIKELREGGYGGVILLVTAQATEEVASGGLQAGATDYVFKARGYPSRVLDELLDRLGETA